MHFEKGERGFSFRHEGPLDMRLSPDNPLTADAIVLTRESSPRVLLIRRKHPPFTGAWALPGGFVDPDEPLENAVRRELREETGLDIEIWEQIQTFGDPGRDPRGWTVASPAA